MQKKILIHSDQEGHRKLLEIMSETDWQVLPVASVDDFSEQETLLIAFPQAMPTDEDAVSVILDQTFLQIQRFVQARIRKKSGQILVLIDARANGMSYEKTETPLSQIAYQGALTGFVKTISKEYSKKGLTANAIYIDWAKIYENPAHLIATINGALDMYPALAGQVVPVDYGVAM